MATPPTPKIDWGAVGFSLWMLSPFLALFAFVAFIDLALR